MTIADLEKEHKRLVIQMHPDRNPNNPKATEEFQEMQAQYEERKGELQGDYTKARKGRERREREEREREERERKERERRKVEQAVSQARMNRQLLHTQLKVGDYIYARQVNAAIGDYDSGEDVLRMAVKHSVLDDTVVMIEHIVECRSCDIMNVSLTKLMGDGNIYGGWDILQHADPANGVKKTKRVAKVVMFRSDGYCFFGNPKGDKIISDYYLPVSYEVMFGTTLGRIRAKIVYEEEERRRKERERVAKLLEEQKPLIEQWSPKLIGISAALSVRERETVALNNLKTILKEKFPGVTFKFTKARSWNDRLRVKWEDGPTNEEFLEVARLFHPLSTAILSLTPWQERFGDIDVVETERSMSVLTKAKILQKLGSVTQAFCEGAMLDTVTVSEIDWVMLHLLVGVSVTDPDARLCASMKAPDGNRKVSISDAVRYIFLHSSYAKEKKTARKKAV